MQNIKRYASETDYDLDMGGLALEMISPSHEGVSLDRYKNHLTTMVREVKRRYGDLISEGADDDAGVRLAALKFVISETHGYKVDSPHAEILEGADIMRVIDRASGCPAALCVLYMDIARKAGWDVVGLNFPGLFLCRLEYESIRIIFDPSAGCKVMEAYDLRERVKTVLGEEAELSKDYFDGLGPRDTVICLYNLIKLRYIEVGDYEAALGIVERLSIVSPDEYRLLFDDGVLSARLGKMDKAISALELYIEKAPTQLEKQEAFMLLEELRTIDT